MSSAPPSPEPQPASTLPSDFDPAAPASLPGPVGVPAATLWSDSDGISRAGGGFAGLVASPADKAMPTIGHIGRYALKHQLGAGGLGTVYAAHDPLLSRLIAVKTLNVEIKDEERESFNRIFIDEARAAGGLSHPHIVTVFDAGISDDRAYIAMELLKGKDLRQLMQEGWRATPAQAALIVRRVADALAYAHSKGVIHRDVKPANIFMVGRTQPRVLDFGIARVTHRHEQDVNAGAGSPYYMAPEQVRREHTDRRADVFSLGVVLYELLTATKPFTGDSLKTIAEQVQRFEPPPVSKIDPTVPRELAAIVARAMEKDPDKRFRSARSFARELRQWLDSNLGPADADGAPMPAPARPARRRRALAWVSAGVAATLVAGAGGLLAWESLQAAPPATAAVTTPRVAVAATAQPRMPVAAPSPVAPSPMGTPAPANTAPAAVGLAVAAVVSPAPAAQPVAVAAVPPAPAAPIGVGVGVGVGIGTGSGSAAPVTAPATAPVTAAAAATAAATIAAPPAGKVAAPAPTVAAPLALVAAAAVPGPAKETARERRAREAREARERELRAATPAPPATGKVRLAVSPWGLVEVNGASSGAAPPLTELTLAEGRHQIVVRNGDFPPFVASVDVVAGQVTALRHKFGS